MNMIAITVIVVLSACIGVASGSSEYDPRWKVACFDAATGALDTASTAEGYCVGDARGPAESEGCPRPCQQIDGCWVCPAPKLSTVSSNKEQPPGTDTAAALRQRRCHVIVKTELEGAVNGASVPAFELFQWACFSNSTGRPVRSLKPDGFCHAKRSTHHLASGMCASAGCEADEGASCAHHAARGDGCYCVTEAAQNTPVDPDSSTRCAVLSAAELAVLIRHHPVPPPF